jgi:uncharacterized delta-60 repeat protein
MPTGLGRCTLLCAAVLILGRPAPAAAQAGGQVDPSFDAGVVDFAFGSSFIRSVALQPDGKVLVGGAFSSIAGVTRHGLARLNPDGTVDPSFAWPFTPGARIPFASTIVVQPDGRILVGGAGMDIGPVQHFVVRLLPDGSLDPSFTLLPMNASAGIDTITLLPDGRFYLGGDHGSIGLTDTRTVTRMNADGTVDPTFTIQAVNYSGRALSIAVEPGGSIIAGGRFSGFTPGGAPFGPLTRFSSSGAIDTTFAPAFDDPSVNTIKSVVRRSDGTILVGGLFHGVDGVVRRSLVHLTATGAVIPAFDLQAPVNDIRAMLLDGEGRLLITGNLYLPGTGPTNERRGIARVNADTGAFDAFYPPNGLEVGGIGNALAVQPDAKVLVVGEFFQLGGGITRWRVARLLDVVNTPPVAAGDGYTTAANTPLTVPAPGVLGNDTDANGDPLTAVLVAPPASGTLALQGNGAFTYTPAAGFTGNVSFTYRASDGVASSSPATVSIAVLPPPLTYLLAEGSTGAFFDLDVLIANPNAAAAPVTVTFLKDDGTTVTQNLILAATTQRTLHVDAIPGLAGTAVSTVVTSTAGLPLVVERSMFWDSSYYGSHGATAVDGPHTRWYFAEGSEGFFSTFLLLANASALPATVTVSFLTETAGTVTRTYTVPPTSRLTVAAGSIPQIVNRSFAMVVESNVPIVAERAMYFGAARLWDGGHESTGVSAPASNWFLAEGATGPFFDTFILLANPNPTPASVVLTFLTDTGASIVRTRTVAANARLTVNMELEDPLLANAAASTTISASQPIVVERAMYWPGSGLQWSEAHNSFGVTGTSTKWGLAEGRVGTARAFVTYILLANPSTTTAALVRVTYLRATGAPVVKTYAVNPTSRLNIDVNSQVPELVDESFGALIEITNGVGIVVERSLYNNALGQVWAAGTNALGTPLP